MCQMSRTYEARQVEMALIDSGKRNPWRLGLPHLPLCLQMQEAHTSWEATIIRQASSTQPRKCPARNSSTNQSTCKTLRGNDILPNTRRTWCTTYRSKLHRNRMTPWVSTNPGSQQHKPWAANSGLPNFTVQATVPTCRDPQQCLNSILQPRTPHPCSILPQLLSDVRPLPRRIRRWDQTLIQTLRHQLPSNLKKNQTQLLLLTIDTRKQLR